MTARARNVLNGLFAAIPTPIRENGQIDPSTLDRLVTFVLNAGVDGVCIGGATGEYPHFEIAERKAVIRQVAAIVPRDRALLVGIGGPSARHVVDVGRAAMEAGSRALLLPMPMFFRYGQDDLRVYCEHVSRTLAAPCLLYDLPDFTNGLSPKTVLTLLNQEEFVVGIKDSSGRVERLAAFAAPPGRHEWTLLVGDDRLLQRGLLEGWNGGISGVAALCPELSVHLWRAFDEGRVDESARLQRLVDELIVQLATFPAPWGIRIGLAARGIDTGPLPLPVTPERQRQIREFQEWLPAWLPRAIEAAQGS
jgi:dihydrodipicolinate synthase/N-acetylneuraminate lyase